MLLNDLEKLHIVYAMSKQNSSSWEECLSKLVEVAYNMNNPLKQGTIASITEKGKFTLELCVSEYEDETCSVYLMVDIDPSQWHYKLTNSSLSYQLAGKHIITLARNLEANVKPDRNLCEIIAIRINELKSVYGILSSAGLYNQDYFIRQLCDFAKEDDRAKEMKFKLYNLQQLSEAYEGKAIIENNIVITKVELNDREWLEVGFIPVEYTDDLTLPAYSLGKFGEYELSEAMATLNRAIILIKGISELEDIEFKEIPNDDPELCKQWF